jgi:hypothetical protein
LLTVPSTIVSDFTNVQLTVTAMDIYGNYGVVGHSQIMDAVSSSPIPTGVDTVTALQSDDTHVNLTITDADAVIQGIVSYKVYMAIGAEPTDDSHSTVVNAADGNTTNIDISFIIDGEISDHYVYFTVKAINDDGVASLPTTAFVVWFVPAPVPVPGPLA